MSGHTPGPWEYDHMTGGSYCVCKPEGAIADVWTTEPDARLIAAAPDLLAACKWLAYPKNLEDAIAAAEAAEKAIAKAEGK